MVNFIFIKICENSNMSRYTCVCVFTRLLTRLLDCPVPTMVGSLGKAQPQPLRTAPSPSSKSASHSPLLTPLRPLPCPPPPTPCMLLHKRPHRRIVLGFEEEKNMPKLNFSGNLTNTIRNNILKLPVIPAGAFSNIQDGVQDGRQNVKTAI